MDMKVDDDVLPLAFMRCLLEKLLECAMSMCVCVCMTCLTVLVLHAPWCLRLVSLSHSHYKISYLN